MVWMSRAHRSFVGLDASSYISRCSLCEWCKTQRHNDHCQLLQVRNSFVVLSFGPGQLAPMEPAQCHSVCECVSACLRATCHRDLSTNFSLALALALGLGGPPRRRLRPSVADKSPGQRLSLNRSQ